MYHSKYSPSSAYRWLRCPGSLYIGHRHQEVNNAAIRGTALHKVAEKCLKTGNSPESYFGCLMEDIDDHVSEEDVDAIRSYVSSVYKCMGYKSKLFVEETVDYSVYLNVTDEKAFGTVDSAVFNGKSLHVFDFKTGFKHVSSFYNEQLMLYAVGLIDKHDDLREITEIYLHISQEKSFKTNFTTVVSIDELFTFVNRASEKVKSDKRIPGPIQCQYCPAALNCKEFLEYSDDILYSGHDNSIKDIKKILDKKEMMLQLISKAEKEAIKLLSLNIKIGNYKLHQNRRLTWNKDAEEKLRNEYGNEIYNKKLKSIGEMTKIFKNINNFTHYKKGTLSIKEITNG